MFRLTIRDVLWLMVVVGASLGWWNEHRQWAELYELVSNDVKVPPTKGTSQSPLAEVSTRMVASALE